MKNLKETLFDFMSSWEKKQKVFLLVGIVMLVLTLTVTILDFYAFSERLYAKVDNSEVISFLREKNIIPSALATIWRSTLTFTSISNYLLAINFIIYPFYWKNKKTQSFLFVSMTWISITFIVFWALISWNGNSWKRVDSSIKSIIVHVVNPMIAYIMFIFVRKDFSLSKKAIILSSLLVLGYFIFALIAFSATHKYANLPDPQTTKDVYDAADITIYKFLNPINPLFYKGQNIFVQIILNILLLIGASVLPPVLGLGLKLIYRLPWRKNKEN
ncbi:MAGa3780 family membrane protein [Mycoplasmopsis alligatoris]|uniref:Uncharacterized protein n=1 Tax=Mycoplasmopsis alligatoris A21JP2 TaxID=747682 RepID=D4XWK2_9BACT|nr:hypothetical protein [Mycoplasmopsis alligatoris]EFF41165.1 hypothetical protein MALL_0428 [Mycoplasmopsis alligatoris A21JP2]